MGSFSQALGTFLVLKAYGLSMIPLSYCYSMAFATPSAAQVAVAALNFVLGFCAVNGSYVSPTLQAILHSILHDNKMSNLYHT